MNNTKKEVAEAIAKAVSATKKLMIADFKAAGCTLKLSEDDLNRAYKEPIKVIDWVHGDKPQWQWLIYVSHKKSPQLVCELWGLEEGDHPQDIDWAPYEERQFHSWITKKFPAVPGELHLRPNGVRWYSEAVAKAMAAAGLDDIYGEIPEVYRGREIDRPGNTVHAEVRIIAHDGKVYRLPKQQFGSYEVDIPKCRAMIVQYLNTGRCSSKTVAYIDGLRSIFAMQHQIRQLLEH